MWAYSAPPLRLKSRPGFDLLSHALFVQTWPYLICIWLTGSVWTRLDSILIGICFLTSLSGQLNQQVRDFDVDTRTDTNFATRVGLATTTIVLRISNIAMIMFCIAVVVGGHIPWLFVPLGLMGLPKVAYQLLQRFNSPMRIFPRSLLYATNVLALFYTVFLMGLEFFSIT
jgi:4-hydroxybenzoate polyprenyltransferase